MIDSLLSSITISVRPPSTSVLVVISLLGDILYFHIKVTINHILKYQNTDYRF